MKFLPCAFTSGSEQRHIEYDSRNLSDVSNSHLKAQPSTAILWYSVLIAQSRTLLRNYVFPTFVFVHVEDCGVCMHSCVHVFRGQRLTSEVFLNCFPLRQDLSLNLELTSSASCASFSMWVLGIAFRSSCWVTVTLLTKPLHQTGNVLC